MTRLNAIPCNVITGFLGVGKTTCIQNLLTQKPEAERWAILINEFGEIGLDGQLLEHSNTPSANVFIREVPGGCMCCSSGLPMQIALNFLLMKTRPDRLLIEPTGLGHPREVIRTLRGEHYAQVLSLQNTLTLVNPKHFSSQKHLQNATFQQQLAVADVLIVNKSDLATEEDTKHFHTYLAEHNKLADTPYHLTTHGQVPLDILTKKGTTAKPVKQRMFKLTPPLSPKQDVFTESTESMSKALPEDGFLIEAHESEGFVSIGGRIESSQRFELAGLLGWLASLKALRIKALIHCAEGWVSINASDEQQTIDSQEPTPAKPKKKSAPDLQYSLISKNEPSESRLEMIFEKGDEPLAFRSELTSCLLKNIQL